MRKFLLSGLILGASLATFATEEKLIIVDEGSWQADNGRLSYFEDGRMISNEWFRETNGYKLGDNPCDIIAVKENLIAIAVRGSNLIQFINEKGEAIAAVEDLPNIRCMATDGRYIYVTSYAHECQTASGKLTFTKGYVAKIDTEGFSVVSACEVGYEPEGIALYNGHLFVANSGGYSFQEDHDYESTIYLLDPSEMKKTGEIETNRLNLYGRISQSGKYLCLNSAGNYYDVAGCGLVIDCEKALTNPGESFASIPYLATYNTTAKDNKFLAIGSEYSFTEGGYIYTCLTIDAPSVIESKGESGYSTSLPGTMAQDIEKMTSPYGIYMNPFTGMLYATDAGSYGSAGKLYQWSPDGKLIGEYPAYINPGWFLALRPDSYQDSVEAIEAGSEDSDTPVYDLFGRRVAAMEKGHIYIKGGRKIIL
ncbi:MAG: hypothetical protein K2M31_09955 [Muribaculaceae bacterium]|nr:hypothetical protein [Muribaculaceae bacterium]